MIVRNERAVIERCLRSVRPHVDAWAIADTGSQDGTQDFIRAFLADLPGELIERPWVDFSTNRNEALQLARRYGDYALFIDADDALEVDAGFDFTVLDGPFYAIERSVRGVSSWTPGLARLDVAWAWQGVLHEVLGAPEPVPRQRLHTVRLRTLEGGARGKVGLREKYARDAETLRAALEREPDNTRYQFYLARSLLESGQYQDAIDAFVRRSGSGGWDQEVYVSKLMVAVLKEQTGADDEDVVSAYEEAHRFRPQRAESLTRLAHFLNKRGRFEQASRCARTASTMPIPEDTLMLDRGAYGWKARDDLAVALHHLGDQRGCAAAYEEMLADRELPPRERERVERNLRETREAIARRRAPHVTSP